MKFSIVIPVFNEEKRIIPLIKSLVDFCDDIIIINKSSNDLTVEIIKSVFFEHVTVVNYPYSQRGVDDFKSYCSHSKYDWVFVCVASEVVKEGFWIELERQVNAINISDFDVIMIPRLYYCFGFNVPNSPWDISYFPFFFNKNTVVFSDRLHEHFTVKDESKRCYMKCAKHNMLPHLTHQTVDGFFKSTLTYASIEVAASSEAEKHHLLIKWVGYIRDGFYKLDSTPGQNSLMHLAAWNVYWSTHILMLCESNRESTAEDLYRKIRYGKINDIAQSNLKLGNEFNYFKVGLFNRIVFNCKELLKSFMIKSPILRVLIYKCRDRLLRR